MDVTPTSSMNLISTMDATATTSSDLKLSNSEVSVDDNMIGGQDVFGESLDVSDLKHDKIPLYTEEDVRPVEERPTILSKYAKESKIPSDVIDDTSGSSIKEVVIGEDEMIILPTQLASSPSPSKEVDSDLSSLNVEEKKIAKQIHRPKNNRRQK